MTRFTLFLSLTLFALGCGDSKKEVTDSIPFYVGTYTEGESQGIYKYTLSDDGTLKEVGLVAAAENPSFLAFAADGQYLLAVNEVSDENQNGYLSSFEVGKDTLSLVDRKPSGGAHPCHVVTNSQGYVVGANYSGGNMGVLKLQGNGRLSELLDVQQHEGSGPHPRQEGPHAHSGWFAENGSVISVDLGTNQLWFSRIDPKENKFKSQEPYTFSLEPQAGPRHLAFHPQKQWIYVVNELSSSVSLLKKGPAGRTLEIAQTISTLPEDFNSQNTCADIHVSPDGKFLYASNRGHNSIAIYTIDSENGTLKALGHEPTGGKTPRNFAMSPDGTYLLVANQTTNNIVSFKRDQHTGLLTYLNEIGAPSPVCILFAP